MMKTALQLMISLGLTLSMVLSCDAQIKLPANFLVSKPRENVYLVLLLMDASTIMTNAPAIPIDGIVKYAFGSTDGTNHTIYSLAKEYAFMISATDEAGVEVPKTRFGRKFGSKYFEVGEFARNRLFWERVRGVNRDRPYWNKATEEISSPTRELPRMDELFKFEHPGTYTVNLKIQCFVALPDDSAIKLARFPALSFKVEKGQNK